MFVFYVSFVWKVYKPVTVQYYMADHVIWLPRLTLLDFWTLSQNRTHSFVGDLVYFRRRHWRPTPVLLPGKSHGQRSLVGCSPWDRQESDTTEQLHFHFSLSCTGEGNGNPLVFLPGESQGRGSLGGLPSMGSHRVGHDWSDSAAAAAALLIQCNSREAQRKKIKKIHGVSYSLS